MTADRAGPPTPRNEPWTPEQPHLKARDVAWTHWIGDRDLAAPGSKQHVNLIAREAFNAGWTARKAATYRGVLGLDRSAADMEEGKL